MVHIGRLAAAAGLSVDAIRYYERRGLIPRAPRSAAGYRLYDRGVLRRLQWILSLQTFGLSLDEIAELLNAAAGAPGCVQVSARIERQLGRVRDRVRQMQELERMLAGVLSHCERNLRRRRSSPCPALDELDSGVHTRV